MTTYIVAPARGRTPMAAQLALTFGIAFVVLVAVLHGVHADLVPRAHVLSEYALGPTGWLMALAFFTLAASFSALLVALWTSLPGWRGALGRTTLAIAAIGAAMGGLFPMDVRATLRLHVTLMRSTAVGARVVQTFLSQLPTCTPSGIAALR